MTVTAPAGWYPDGSGALRWWDGVAWTDHVAPAPQPVPAQLPAAQVVLPDGAPAARSTYDAVALSSWSDPSARASAGTSVLPGTTQAYPAQSFSPSPSAMVAPHHAPAAAPSGQIGGSWLVAGGLALILFGMNSMKYGLSHGYFSTGGAISGTFLVVRGVMRIRETNRSRPAGTPLMPVGRVSPLLAGLMGFLVLMLGYFFLTAPGNPPPPDAATTSSGTTAALPAGSSTWPVGYKPVAPDGAYRISPSNRVACVAGTSCAEVWVITRAACAKAVVTVDVFDEAGTMLSPALRYGVPGANPDIATAVMVSSKNPDAARFTVTRIACG